MSEALIEVINLSKIYRLYHTQRSRIFDLLGIPISHKSYDEFWALRNINLTVYPGERLGIVGRNGAGKSTLLKIIAGLLKPSQGSVNVMGKIQALMELGTGFHPDFTGRQNVFAALSYQGISGKEAKTRYEEIVEFSELEDFIENPLRTYSSGMYARLAFSVATAIQPEILIIDEVLGAGDAYFAGKCLDRMKTLTSDGATVLFVSHDVGAVERMCSRAIWLERGQMLMNDNTLAVSKAYSAAIRRREMLRLQARNSQMNINTLERIRRSNNSPIQLICRLVDPDMAIDINLIELEFNQDIYASLRIGNAQDTAITEDAFILIDHRLGHWGPPREKDQISWRTVSGGINQSAAVVFNLDGLSPKNTLSVRVRLRGGRCKFQCFDGDIYRDLGKIEKSNAWQDSVFSIPIDLIAHFLKRQGLLDLDQMEEQPLVENQPAVAIGELEEPDYLLTPSIQDVDDKMPSSKLTPVVNNSIVESAAVLSNRLSFDQYDVFTGDIIFDDVRIFGADGKDRYIFQTFEELNVEIKFRLIKPIDKPEFVVALYREGVVILQSLSRLQGESPDSIPINIANRAILHIPEIPFGKGTYMISIGVFPPLDGSVLDTERIAYLLQDRRYEIKVDQPESLPYDLGVARCNTQWDFTDDSL